MGGLIVIDEDDIEDVSVICDLDLWDNTGLSDFYEHVL